MQTTIRDRQQTKGGDGVTDRMPPALRQETMGSRNLLDTSIGKPVLPEGPESLSTRSRKHIFEGFSRAAYPLSKGKTISDPKKETR